MLIEQCVQSCMSVRDLSFTVQLTHWAKQYLGNSEEGFFFFFKGMREHGGGVGGLNCNDFPLCHLAVFRAFITAALGHLRCLLSNQP